MQIIDALNWRYATKRMNGKKVSQEQLNRILESVRLSASSMGLQPYTIFVVENEELRKKIQPGAYNQPQITECSHLLVFAAWDNVTEQHADEYLENIALTRGVTPESLNGFKGMLMGIVNGRSKEEKYEWSARQVYLALGTALAAAALEQVDSTPMEGFVPDEVDKILDLNSKGLKSVALLTLGFRDTENDHLAEAKKVRRSAEKLFVNL
ncbi:MAG: nitroreductase family protein [Ignavibacteriota bacterium]